MKKTLFFSLLCIITFTGCVNGKVQTIDNIKSGIATALTAKAKYSAFAEQARTEGHVAIAKLFDAASKAEDIHASNHETVLSTFKEKMDEFKPVFQVKTTAVNLQNAIEGTTNEVDSLFPLFIKDATSKKLKKETISSLTWALEAEKAHKKLFTEALEALKTNKESTLPLNYLVCPICGETYDKTKASSNCIICNASRDIFLDLK